MRCLTVVFLGIISFFLFVLGINTAFVNQTQTTQLSDIEQTATVIDATNQVFGLTATQLIEYATASAIASTTQSVDPFVLTATQLVENASQTAIASATQSAADATNIVEPFALTATQLIFWATASSEAFVTEAYLATQDITLTPNYTLTETQQAIETQYVATVGSTATPTINYATENATAIRIATATAEARNP
ncbi:MAG: hypothetical protein AAFV98_24215 [Chloroflexota bacterium]